jgi:ATPase family associated with various cellular activities (AAA)
MNIHIDRAHAEALADAFTDLATLKDQLRFGDRVEVAVERMPRAALAMLGDFYANAGPAMQPRAAQITTLIKALHGDGRCFRTEDLEDVLPAIAGYLVTQGTRGWLFSMHAASRPLPYVITRLDYTPPSNDEPGRVFIELKANAKATVMTAVLRFGTSDIAGKTIGEILAAKGFVPETPELVAAYDATAQRYFDWRARHGVQFSGRGTGFYAEDPNATHRDTDWSRKDVVILSASGVPSRLVNDETILSNRVLTLDVRGDILGPYLRKAAKSNAFNAEDEAAEMQAAIPEGMFRHMPVHPYVLMFHLDLHHYVWVHADDAVPYEFQPTLKQKLVLPPEQTDLIDILTAEMDVLADDIIAGKSGGTTVLCAGPPGVGKTLTAEVYSEIIKRPLYRVHSGQLGLNVGAMEQALKDVLTRAQRWGAVVLIDEADVYIRRREDNMAANAVVGVFLRVLEYFNGLLFLTTNRVDDIDEAIVSRCIALIKYETPDREARCKIWRVMMEQFGLSDALHQTEALADLFPAASGRDIKGPIQAGGEILPAEESSPCDRNLPTLRHVPRARYRRRAGGMSRPSLTSAPQRNGASRPAEMSYFEQRLALDPSIPCRHRDSGANQQKWRSGR